MPLKFDVSVQQFDAYGNYTREALPINDAILKLLRFARQFPGSVCTIELRETAQSVVKERPLDRNAHLGIALRPIGTHPQEGPSIAATAAASGVSRSAVG